MGSLARLLAPAPPCTCASQPERIAIVARGHRLLCPSVACKLHAEIQAGMVAAVIREADKAFAATFGGSSIMDDFVVLLGDLGTTDGKHCILDPREVVVHTEMADWLAWQNSLGPVMKNMRRSVTARVARFGAEAPMYALYGLSNGVLIMMCRRSIMHLAPAWVAIKHNR